MQTRFTALFILACLLLAGAALAQSGGHDEHVHEGHDQHHSGHESHAADHHADHSSEHHGMAWLHEILMSAEGFHYFGTISNIGAGSFTLTPERPDFAPEFLSRELPGATKVSFSEDTIFMAGDSEVDAGALTEAGRYVVLGHRTEGAVEAYLVGDEEHVRGHVAQMKDRIHGPHGTGHPFVGRVVELDAQTMAIEKELPQQLVDLLADRGISHHDPEAERIELRLADVQQFGSFVSPQKENPFRIGDMVVVFHGMDELGADLKVIDFDSGFENLKQMLEHHLEMLERHSG